MMLPLLRIIYGVVFCLGAVLSWSAQALDSNQLAVVVNTQDPLSVQIGEYYAKQRHILFQNYIKVSFPSGSTTLTREEFGRIKAEVGNKTLPHIQAYALTWAAPYRVECMSITTAFAFGFDPAFCASGCKPTRTSPYFNSSARLPYRQLGMRPTMAIAATSFENAKALIDRGVESDGSMPTGTTYLLSTSDTSRNVRSALYPLVDKLIKGRVPVRLLTAIAYADVVDP
ncbi:MAG: TIGR03790 family protein [Georgfuchsia sp.]